MAVSMATAFARRGRRSWRNAARMVCSVSTRSRRPFGRSTASSDPPGPSNSALDGVSDTSPTNLMNCLSESGVLVSYGVMSRKPMVVQPGSLIFKKQTIRGFWLLYWYQSAKPDDITAMFDHLAPLVAAGTISTPVAATYRFDQVREAIAKAAQSGGKVLFTPET